MRFRLDPTSSTGISIQPAQVAKGQSSSFAMKGADGVGVPTGGATNQLLAKSSGSNYDTAWGIAITASTTQPSGPRQGDLWLDIS